MKFAVDGTGVVKALVRNRIKQNERVKLWGKVFSLFYVANLRLFNKFINEL